MSHAPLVLAIEPDHRQASIVKRIVRERVHVDVAVVDSKDAAIDAIRTTMPDVLLVSALLSPRDEDDLIAHLRTLEGASHLQTHTIPQLASTLPGDGPESKGGLFSAFRRKKSAEASLAGCDPDLFADEIRVYLERAVERRREAAEHGAMTPLPPISRARREAAPQPAAEETAAPVAESSWASPFEWRPSQKYAAPSPTAAPAAASLILNPSSEIPNPVSAIPDPESAAEPEYPMPPIEDVLAQAAPPAEVDTAPEPVFTAPEPAVPEPEPLVSAPEPVLAAPEPVVIPELVRQPEPVAAKPRLTVVPPAGIQIVLPARARKAAAESKGRTLEAWARVDVPAGGSPEPNGELPALLSGLGVPDSIASITYPRGVRIRRVRVLASREANAGHGPLVAAKRLLAELRDGA